MPSKDLVDYDAARLEEMAKVVELYTKNYTSREISKQLHIKHVNVLEHIDDWKKSAVGSQVVRDRVEELVSMADKHYSNLIKKGWEIIDEIDSNPQSNHQYLAQKNSAIKLVADLERNRIDFLQKSGLLEAADQTEALEEMQENIAALMDILREELCEPCKRRVWERLGTLTGKVEPVVVYQNE